MATKPDPSAIGQLETTTVRLPAEMLAYLRDEAASRGISTGDMLRVAIGTQKFLTEEVKHGAKVRLHSRKGDFDVTL